MHYTVSIDVPELEAGIRFYADAFGYTEKARPIATYAVLQSGDSEIGIIEKPAGSYPAKGSEDVRRYQRHWTPVHVDFHVDDFAKSLAEAVEAGALIEQQFGGGAHSPVAFCSDPFGNGFCIIGRRNK